MHFRFEAALLCVSDALLRSAYSSGENEARQLLAPCPKCLPEHSPTNAAPQINELPRAGGGVSSDHLHSARPRGPGAAAPMPWVLDPQRRRLPSSSGRVQDVVPARWPGSSGRGQLRHERICLASSHQCALACAVSPVASCRPQPKSSGFSIVLASLFLYSV